LYAYYKGYVNFVLGYSPDAEKYDASQDINVLNLESAVYAELGWDRFGMTRPEIMDLMAYCYTRPMDLSSPENQVFKMKKIMRLSGAADTSVGNTIVMLSILSNIVINAIRSIQLKKHIPLFKDPTIIDHFELEMSKQFKKASKIFKFTGTDAVKQLEELTYLRCYFYQEGQSIQMAASFGLFGKAMSVIADYKKYTDLDIQNQEHILAFRKVVLSSLLSLPHHLCFENLIYTFENYSDIDLSAQDVSRFLFYEEIKKEIEDSFIHKNLVDWGSKSEVIDEQIYVATRRYKITYEDLEYFVACFAFPAVQNDERFVKVSNSIYGVDYGA
jgi:hypothetical protein